MTLCPGTIALMRDGTELPPIGAPFGLALCDGTKGGAALNSVPGEEAILTARFRAITGRRLRILQIVLSGWQTGSNCRTQFVRGH